MRALTSPLPLPAPMRALRRSVRDGIGALAWLLPPLAGGLAAAGGLGWETSALLAMGIAAAASASARSGGRIGASLALSAGCLLVMGAGQAVLPAALLLALPFAALATVACLADIAALAAAAALLMAPPLLRTALGETAEPAMPASLAACAALLALGQLLVRRTLSRPALLAPARPPAAPPCWSVPRIAPPPALLVQAERGADGALRVAIAGTPAGRLKVTVR